MGRFRAGESGNPLGMRPGTKHKVTKEIRALTQSLFDVDFWKATKTRLREGKEHPAIVLALLRYAYGKPQDSEQKPTTTITVGALSVLHDLGRLPGTTPALPVIAAKANGHRDGEH